MKRLALLLLFLPLYAFALNGPARMPVGPMKRPPIVHYPIMGPVINGRH